MDLTFTPAQVELRERARAFAEKVLADGARYRDEHARFSEAIIQKLAGAGFLGFTIAKALGGLGYDLRGFTEAIREISRVDAGIALILISHSLLCQTALAQWGSEQQKNKYLPRLANGEILASYAIQDNQYGSSHLQSVATTAHRDGDQYRLNGTKAWISHGESARLFFVFARSGEKSGGDDVSMYMIEKDREGLTASPQADLLGLRSAGLSKLELAECVVPLDHRLGEEGAGRKIAGQLELLNNIGLAAQALGITEAALEKSVSYAKQRRQFNRFIAEFEVIQDKLADIGTNFEAARSITSQAAADVDAGNTAPTLASMAKLFATTTAMNAANEAVQIHGGYGYLKEHGIERLMRDAKVMEIFGGSAETQRAFIAHKLLNREHFSN
ncbi:MAG TPA: acyl-CoA dehydrogenase family protein [bacterium]|nr:acyl-CoA dehydrogenase family protein [bacterium]